MFKHKFVNKDYETQYDIYRASYKELRWWEKLVLGPDTRSYKWIELDREYELDQIRREVEEDFLLSTDIREFLTVSIGASSYPNHGHNLEEILYSL